MMVSKEAWCILAGVCVRAIVFGLGGHSVLRDAYELTTPLTNIARVKEGVHLLDLGISPYNGSVVHHPVLILGLFAHIPAGLLPILFIALDVCTALLLGRVAETMSDKPSNARVYTMACVLLNPFSVMTCVSMSTALLTHLALALVVWFATSKSFTKSCLSLGVLGFAAYTDLYALYQLPSVLLLCMQHNHGKGIGFAVLLISVFVVTVSGLLWASSASLAAFWEFMYGVYGASLFVTDLKPNIGLSWYFMIEVFDHFRSLFLFTFQFIICLCVLGVCLRLSHHPLFIFYATLAVTTVLRPFPAMGDVILYIIFLSMHTAVVKRMRVWVFGLYGLAYCAVLSPIFWELWIYRGSANVNYTYPLNLAFGAVQGVMITESVFQRVRLDDDISSKQKAD